METQPQQYLPGGRDAAGTNTAGNTDGTGSTADTITGIVIAPSGGQTLTEYDFGEYLLATGNLTQWLESATTTTTAGPVASLTDQVLESVDNWLGR